MLVVQSMDGRGQIGLAMPDWERWHGVSWYYRYIPGHLRQMPRDHPAVSIFYYVSTTYSCRPEIVSWLLVGIEDPAHNSIVLRGLAHM